MTVRDLLAGDITVLGSAKLSISSATTSNFDFGTPNDLDLEALLEAGSLKHEDRLVAVFSATTSGSTDTVSFSVQDAPDSSGSIGTPATAVTDGPLTGGTGDQYAVAGIRIQPGRTWLRLRATSDGDTDTFAVTCSVLAIRRNA